LARAAKAAPAPAYKTRRKTLVAIFQRGAMDGLMAVTPFTDPMIAQFRPRLGMTAASAAGDARLLDLDGRFGLHPALAPLLPLYQEKRLAIVHGVGSPDPSRSHFDAQDYMETGTPGVKGTRSGWLNRAVGLLGHETSPFCAVSLTSSLPRSLSGENDAIAISNLNEFGLQVPRAPKLAQAAGKSFEALYDEATQDLLKTTGEESFDAIKMLKSADPSRYSPANGADYPKSPLGNALRQIAQLIKADLGLETAFAETGGWDTHFGEGTVNGVFARRADDLARSVAAFWTDLGNRQDDVALMTMTEFGRTVRENGSGGTDHGRGSCLFILADSADGGKVHGSVPASLEPEALADGRDLPVTTDFRSVFAEVAGKHLRITKDTALFPGWKGGRMPLLKA
jgi:uncharacterized protein (DUF1501 family)